MRSAPKVAPQPRVRRIRKGSIATTRWYCSTACAAAERDKAETRAVTPAGVPKGKRCAVCQRKIPER
jgi:hypothetical protein